MQRKRIQNLVSAFVHIFEYSIKWVIFDKQSSHVIIPFLSFHRKTQVLYISKNKTEQKSVTVSQQIMIDVYFVMTQVFPTILFMRVKSPYMAACGELSNYNTADLPGIVPSFQECHDRKLQDEPLTIPDRRAQCTIYWSLHICDKIVF